MRGGTRGTAMWVKNLVFLSLVSLGAIALLGGLFPQRIPHLSGDRTVPHAPVPDYQPVVEEIDRCFAQQWEDNHLVPAAQASDLPIARRLALALTGSVPSLEEIRQLESQPPGERLKNYL